MSKPESEDTKAVELRQQNALNPRPHKLRDRLFVNSTFFDARDLVQVKYEMLRRVHHDGLSVSQVCADFGFSRPSYYEIQAAFEAGGLLGLLPQQRGPRRRHKLSPEILDFIAVQRKEQPGLGMIALLALIESRFGVALHRRTVERGLSGKKKRRKPTGAKPRTVPRTAG